MLQLLRKLLFAATFTSHLASAKTFNPSTESECTTVRLDQHPGALSKIPIQDQDGNSLCTAYAASQLIDSWRIQNDPPVHEFTSPFALGIKYSSLRNRNELYALPPEDVLNAAKNISPCSYSSVGDYFQSQMSTMDLLNELDRAHRSANSNPAQLMAAASKVQSCFVRNDTSSGALDISAISRHLRESTFVRATQNILEGVCKDRKVSLKNIPSGAEKLATEYGHLPTAMNEFKKIISRRLQSQPGKATGTSFCRDVFFDADKRSLLSTGGFTVSPTAASSLKARYEVSPNGCSDDVHNAVVVGRRLARFRQPDGKIGSVCQYLIRDSYGTSCNPFPPDNSTTPSTRCERGQIWVDEDAFLANVGRVFHLRD
ncbi:MAG: hypothetical protein ACK5Y2_08265 [Bdellovibrionales bacterium]